ncbi:MAG: hypothetical protein F4X31_01560 [Gammaproteobacteria bacterium]|nr:hypothetical protein [Gammaproteobacteria bacterium]
MTASSLTSLAILKVNWDRLNRDYVENFVPFVVECARLSPEPIISLPTVREEMSVRFGLDLPLNTLRHVFNRAAKRGYFKRQHRVFHRVDEKCSTTDFQHTRENVSRTYSRVMEAFVSFVASAHDRRLSTDEAANAIFAFLRDGSLSLLFGRHSHTPRPNSSNRYLVASFLQDAQHSNPTLFEDILLLARGNLLANAMYLPDPGHVSKRFRKTWVYLDTSFILYAAGFAGPDREEPCLELLELLTRQGAQLRCFNATRNEVQGVLDAAANRLASGNLRNAYGPTIEYFLDAGKSASDLELMATRLPNIMRSLGIELVEFPSFEDYKHQMDEQGFENHLSETIGYSNPKALVHDVDCISAMTRLRAGQESFQVEECRALFVTTNAALARQARAYFQSESTPGAIALSITDHALANLLWLKDPTVAPDLPAHRLIADVYAAMQPSTGLWKAYLVEIAKLEEAGKVTPNDYYLLRYSLASKAALMDLTSGEEQAFSEGSVYEVLEMVRQGEQAALRQEFELESKRRDEVEKSLANRNRRTEGELHAVSHKVIVVRRRIATIADRVGKLVRMGTWVVFFPLLLFGIGASLSWERTLPQSIGGLTLLATLVVFLLLSTGNLLFGVTLKAIVDKLEAWAVRAVTRLLLKFLGLD